MQAKETTAGSAQAGAAAQHQPSAGAVAPPGSDPSVAGEFDRRVTRPGPWAALFSHVVWPNWTAALLLVATMWMPHFTGCDGKPVRPAQMWSQIDDGEELFSATAFSWPYLWAGVFAVTLVAIALLRPLHPEWTLFGEAAGIYSLIAVAFLLSAAASLYHWLSGRSPPDDAVWILFCGPAVIGPGVWAATAIRRGDLFSAWARLTTTIAFLAVPTIMLPGTFARESRYGFNLAMLACAVLVPACWALRWRGRRALVDRAAPAEAARYRTAHLVMWVTLVAVICGYYRFLALVS